MPACSRKSLAGVRLQGMVIQEAPGGCAVWTLVTGSLLLCAWPPLPWAQLSVSKAGRSSPCLGTERDGAPPSGYRSLGVLTHPSQGLGVFEFNYLTLGERVMGKYCDLILGPSSPALQGPDY